ncbi:Protein CBG04816 [Caenorhabditis briggsae]|uniref:Protein CBG04816 n=1 Tax=Caenorhabditis briggsae TaxID=6238 RepID=A8WYJ4_CAEBR|nr:Protein CBG04816 [Caenorhabditis briggsae]CAP25452.1 Protein CBG04816 [Caenorhabditis briggsae]
MFKALLGVSALVLAVSCFPPGWPTAEEVKSEMQATGMSSQAADGVIKIAVDFDPKKTSEGEKIREAARATFHKFMDQVDAYMKTQSQADQTAYEAFKAEKKADFDARLAEKKLGRQ